MTQNLFTHHHHGWRQHDIPNSHRDHLITALKRTHDFLNEYEGRYQVEIERTPACSYDGNVTVNWDDDKSHPIAFGPALRRGDHWFRAFEFNVAPDHACRYCGGTGIDHYVGPFFHCWACDGTATQIRFGTFRGFQHKPTELSSPEAHEQYSAYLSAPGEKAHLS